MVIKIETKKLLDLLVKVYNLDKDNLKGIRKG